MSIASPDAPPDPALQAAVEAFAVPVWRLSGQRLAEGMRPLQPGIPLLSARAVALAAQALTRGLPGRLGCRRLAQWVRHVLPTQTTAEAARLARRAEALFTSPAAAD